MSQPATQPAPQNQMLQYYQQWSDKTPFVTRTTTLGIVGVYLLSFFFSADDYLGNKTYYSIFSFEIYRLILSPLVGNSILTIIIILMTYPALGLKMESSLGSSQFLSLIGTISLLTNIVFTVVCLLLFLFGTAEALFYSCSGFWAVVFGLITMECLQVPDATRRMMFIPVDIPNKYFPLALYVLFSLFGGPQLDYAISILVGYMYSKGYLDRLKPTSYYLEELEASGGLLHNVSRGSGWVLAGASLGHDAWIPVNQGETGAGGTNNGSSGNGSGGGGGAPPQGAGASRNVFGFGGGDHDGKAGGAPAPSAPPAGPKDMFPGSGHKSASDSAYFKAPVLSKEEMQARRLAALSNGSNGSNNV